MKVILTCPRTPRCYNTGLENLTLNIAQQLQSHGVEVEIFTTAAHPQKSVVFETVCIREFSALSVRESYFFSPQLFWTLRSVSADIIQVHGYNNLVSLFAILAKKPNQKLVFYLNSSGSHSFFRNCLRKLFDIFIRCFQNKIDFTIYTGEDERAIYPWFSVKPFTVIYPGVDVSAIQTVPRFAEKNRLLCVGRLAKNKGYLKLLPVFAEVVKKNSSARLIIVGDGPDRLLFESLVQKLNLTSQVEFKGAVKRDVYLQELQKTTALILFLEFTNVSTVVMEALAANVPVITNAEATPEFVRKDYVVPIDDPSNTRASAQVILKVLQKPNSFLPSKPVILSWKNVGDQLMQIYKTI